VSETKIVSISAFFFLKAEECQTVKREGERIQTNKQILEKESERQFALHHIRIYELECVSGHWATVFLSYNREVFITTPPAESSWREMQDN